MQDDAVDGEELMVPRVPNPLPGPSARQIAEPDLTGHAVYRSWCRHCVASKGRANAHSSREVVTEKTCCQSCVKCRNQPDAWERQGRERQITRFHF